MRKPLNARSTQFVKIQTSTRATLGATPASSAIRHPIRQPFSPAHGVSLSTRHYGSARARPDSTSSRTMSGQLVWLGATRLQSLDFLAQVVGEVRAVRRLEVTKGSHGCCEMIPLLLHVVEHFSAATFNLTIELLGATMCIGVETLCIDLGFGLDSPGTCTGVGGELMGGPAGLLSDPVGILSALLDQAFGLLGGQLDEPDDGRAGFLPSCHHDCAGHRRLHWSKLRRCRWLNRRSLRHRSRSPSRNWRR